MNYRDLGSKNLNSKSNMHQTQTQNIPISQYMKTQWHRKRRKKSGSSGQEPQAISNHCELIIFKPPPPVGAGGGYMFSGHPSVPLSVRPSVRACVRPSVIHVVVSCFRDISSICWRIFATLLSLVHLGTEMNWLDFGVKRSKVKVTAWPNTSQIFFHWVQRRSCGSKI